MQPWAYGCTSGDLPAMRCRLWAAAPAAAWLGAGRRGAVTRGRRWCREHPGERGCRAPVRARRGSGHRREGLAPGQDCGRRPSCCLT